jgi:hypothetical protein
MQSLGHRTERSCNTSRKSLVNARVPVTDKGPLQFFLNCQFIRNRDTRTIQIHQWSKIDTVIKEFYTEEYENIYLAGNPEVTLDSDQCPTDHCEINNMNKYPYRRLVGSLLYIAITACPDIATAISTALRFSQLTNESYKAHPGTRHYELRQL